MKRARSPRILFYSHNGRSYGHIARICNLAGYVKKEMPGASIACVSGSRHAGLFLPDGVDYLKLPSYLSRPVPGGDVAYEPLLALGAEDFLGLRHDYLDAIFTRFAPDILLVDTDPRGSFHELDHWLLRDSRVNLLCVRGVEDSKDRYQARHEQDRWLDFVKPLFSRILSFMDPRVFDLVAEYDLQAVADRVEHCGYILRPAAAAVRRVPARRRPVKEVLVSVGSGAECFELLKLILRAKRLMVSRSSFRVFTGTGVGKSELRRLKAAAPDGVRLEQFTPDIVREMAASDFFVGCGGYNTLTEVLATGTPSLILPRSVSQRSWRTSEDEQLIHTRRLHDLGAVTAYLPIDEVSPGAIAAKIDELLMRRARPSGPRLDLDGGLKGARCVRQVVRHLGLSDR